MCKKYDLIVYLIEPAHNVCVFLTQSVENHRKECHRFISRLRQTVILVSNFRTSASKKVNEMMLIRTLMVSTTTFERTKEKFCGLRQTVIAPILRELTFCVFVSQGDQQSYVSGSENQSYASGSDYTSGDESFLSSAEVLTFF